MTRLVAFVVAGIVMLAAASAEAQRKRKRAPEAAPIAVALSGFDGERGDALAKATRRALSGADHRIVDDAGEADAIVHGTIDRRGKRWHMSLEIRTVDGDALETHEWKARNTRRLRAQVRRHLRRRPMRRALARARDRAEEARVAAREAAEREAEQAEEAARREAEAARQETERSTASGTASTEAAGVSARHTPGEPGRRLVAVRAGVRVFQRDFAYNQDIFDDLVAYESGILAAAVVSAEVFPIAPIGLVGELAYTPGFDSENSAGNAFPTSTGAYFVGLAGRLPLAGLDNRLAVGYGAHRFRIRDGDGAPRPDIADVDHRFVRAVVSTHRQLGARLAVGASVGYRHRLSSGQLDDMAYFPRLSGAGVDAGAEVRILGLPVGLEAYVGVGLERYFFAMNSEPGDASVAGGAVDQYLGIQTGVGYGF